MAVITVSRALGSYGTDIATAVAQRLGYRLVGREIVDRVAARLGISTASANYLDEQATGWGQSLVDSIIRSLQGDHITAESYRFVAARVLRQVAREGNVVVLGRDAQAVLLRFPNTTHVHITAPEKIRVNRIAEARGITNAQAQRLVQESDTQRRNYVRLTSRSDWSDPLLYDLVINTHRLTVDAGVDIILEAAIHRGAVLKYDDDDGS